MDGKRVYVLMYNDGKDTEVEGVYRSIEGMLEGFKLLISIELHVPVNELPTGAVYTIRDHVTPDVKFTLDELIEYFDSEEIYHAPGGRIITYDKYATLKD